MMTRRIKKCSITECDRTASVCGLCTAHYQRHRKGLPMNVTIKRHRTALMRLRLKPCGVEGCAGGDKSIRGLCPMHYARFLKHGDPLITLRKGRPPLRAELPPETSPSKLARLLGVSKQRAHQLLNKPAHNARALLQREVSAGRIVKPDHCERCHVPTSDLEGHHWDYREPLDVRWLCATCHGAIHRQINSAKKAA